MAFKVGKIYNFLRVTFWLFDGYSWLLGKYSTEMNHAVINDISSSSDKKIVLLATVLVN